jgi:hypothetical protein
MLSDPNTKELRFRLIRKQVEDENCPTLKEAIDALYLELGKVLSVPISLESPPPPIEQGGTVTNDGTSYSLHVAIPGAFVAIRPMGWTNPPLQRSLMTLEAVVAQCATGVEGSIIIGLVR